jgi:hypothetical protein
MPFEARILQRGREHAKRGGKFESTLHWRSVASASLPAVPLDVHGEFALAVDATALQRSGQPAVSSEGTLPVIDPCASTRWSEGIQQALYRHLLRFELAVIRKMLWQ